MDILNLLFPCLGGVMVLIAFLIIAPLLGIRSEKVNAVCVTVDTGTAKLGRRPDDVTYYPNSKRPVYVYVYNGRQYRSSPILTSNRPGYKPKTGPCTIRVNPVHPERVYSSERTFAALIVGIVGLMWLLIPVIVSLLP